LKQLLRNCIPQQRFHGNIGQKNFREEYIQNGCRISPIALPVSALATCAAGMKFDIKNNSDYVINGFHTGEGGEWSANW
jgi:hypothetical protein